MGTVVVLAAVVVAVVFAIRSMVRDKIKRECCYSAHVVPNVSKFFPKKSLGYDKMCCILNKITQFLN